MTIKCLFMFCVIVVIIAIYFPARHARHYNYVKLEHVYDELFFPKTENPNVFSERCDYNDIILNNRELDINDIYKIRPYRNIRQGGEFAPIHCDPFHVAIIVPYRNRTKHLDIFLNYMHYFLQHQHLFYRIFIVNQNDSLPFNRAKMLNYGAKVAIEMGFPCLILHDVDLIPISTGNIYACGKSPRHMSSSLDSFRFNLPYLTLFGGVVSIQTEQFLKVNGMSNIFYGWGGEDDDFYKRLESHNLLPKRFAPSLSTYTMLLHKKEIPNKNRFNNLKYSVQRRDVDGIQSLSDNYTIKFEDLYTLINAT